ncbi:MAG: serine/threonine-protein phosphatase [Synechococcales cyanobacterium C42_A2020_086]|jgi:protein phosphatase|nr:serine/threonine-protein phosphatase [Synechococcales cyanobacterium C42_A2020_086]
MSISLPLHCANPNCRHAENVLGQVVCDHCQTPLIYRYLWAVDAAQIPVGSLVDNRYAVIHPQVWLDTQPGVPPQLPEEHTADLLPYLHLYPQRLHVPELYGVCPVPKTAGCQGNAPPILLLENVPLDPQTGQLYPNLENAWISASAVRQVYWLWQILQLWRPLQQQGVVSSLLRADNLIVDGWRVRLRELISDQAFSSVAGSAGSTACHHSSHREPESYFAASVMNPVPQSVVLSPEPLCPTLAELANLWQLWVEDAQFPLVEPLRDLCQQMQRIGETEFGFQAVRSQLNRLLLEQAAQEPLRIDIAGATTTGPQRSHNEDACYPSADRLQFAPALQPYVGIVCDGIGGHEGGEVASQLALRSLQLQLQALFAELVGQREPCPPAVVEEQLIEVVRVVNNLIAAQNDSQGRASRQRMGTTLVMAVYLPQRIETPNGEGETHELYLVHVGDSRAYWLTPRACQLLTVDDDVITREVRLGRSVYHEARQHPDASALTQALGTRDADSLTINVQRFIIEESGVLLLCSDGLSDNDLVERSWEAWTQPVLKGKLPLAAAVQAWLERADQENGHDNSSVVLMHCRVGVSPDWLETDWLETDSPASSPASSPVEPRAADDPDLTASARALLYDEAESTAMPSPVGSSELPKSQKFVDVWLFGLAFAAVMFILGSLGVAIWRELDPAGFRQLWDQLSGEPSIEQVEPSPSVPPAP